MSHRKTGFIMCVLFVLFAFVGCGQVVVKEYTEKTEGKKSADYIAESENRKEITVLGSYHEDMVKAIANLFEEKTGCRVNYLRLPTGEAQDKLMSEGKEGSCDVWIGGTVDGHELLKEKEILVPYKAEGEEKIADIYLDKDGVWKAQYIEVLSIGVNEELWKQELGENTPLPETLQDLLRPELKGRIIIPDPCSSGTGYTFLSSILFSMGEDGWDYIRHLNEQVGQYSLSGYTAAEKTGLGEYMVCINFLSDQLLVKSFGYPIKSTVYPESGWSPIPVSLTAKGEKNQYAKEFVDFCLTKEVGEVLISLGCVLTVNEDCSIPSGQIKLSELKFDMEYNPIGESYDKEEKLDYFLKNIME